MTWHNMAEYISDKNISNILSTFKWENVIMDGTNKFSIHKTAAYIPSAIVST